MRSQPYIVGFCMVGMALLGLACLYRAIQMIH